MIKKITFILLATTLTTQASAIDFGKIIKNSGADVVKAVTVKESDVIKQSLNAVKQMDSGQKSAPASAKYRNRMKQIVSRVTFPKIKNVKFNVKVYKTEPGNLNAFATPDGSIRFHSALMDVMTDDQLLAVLGHEIGHVVEKHSFNQMRKALLASAAVKGGAGATNVGTQAYNIGGGDLADRFLQSSFSRKDEISADKYSLKILTGAGEKPEAMLDAIGVLKKEFGNGGGMMSSHPSNNNRIKRLKKAIVKLDKK